MARHANDLDFLLNPGAGPAEPDASEHKEEWQRHRDADADEAETRDASPSNKSALAFILDTEDEPFELSDISIHIPDDQEQQQQQQQQQQQDSREDDNGHGDEEEPDGEESEEKEDAGSTTPRQLATTQARAAASRANKAARLPGSSPKAGGTPTRKGSKYCIIEGCTSRAKHSRRCWKHGGSVKCKVADCPNRAKTKGVCWSHGGGTICSVAHCTTIAVSNGVCWAHGGGKRCVVPHCNRPAYERTGNMCTIHYESLHGDGASGGSGEGAAVDGN